MSARDGRAERRAKHLRARHEVNGRLIAPVDAHNFSTYSNHGCRCDECRAGHRAKVAGARARRAGITANNGGVAPVEQHNANTYSNWRCRCRLCVEAWKAARQP